jgi:phospholipase A1
MLCLLFSLWLPLAHAQETPQVATPTPIEHNDKEEQSLLQRHHPFYFAYGQPLSKLELSFKTPIVKTWPLYFGYTQYMFWALKEDSKPFRDLTYNPELFYRFNMKGAGALKSMDLGLWMHDSNGKSGDDSRSYDSNYVRFNFEREGRRWTTRAALQLAYLHGFDPTNRDIQTYISPLSMSVSFIQLFDSWVDKSEVALQASPGGKFAQDWNHGGYQLSWSFRFGGLQLVPAFYLQYYRGFAETLLNYNERVNEFRAGVIF